MDICMREKRFIRLLFTAALTMSLLTGCAEKQAPPMQQAEEEIAGEPTGAVILYSAHAATVSDGKETVLFQQPCDGGFLAMINRKTGENLPEGWEETEGFFNDGRYDRFESALFVVRESGQRKKVRRYRVPAAPEKPEGVDDYFAEMRPCSFCVMENGNIVAIESSYECWKEEHELHTKNHYFVRVLQPNGTEISRAEIETGEQALDGGKTIYLGRDILAAPNGEEILFFGTDGRKRFSVSTSFSVREMCRTEEGKLAAVLKEDKALWISEINALDGTVTVPNRLPEGAHDFCGTGDVHEVYYIRNSEIFRYNLDTGESTRIISLLNLGILPSDVGAFFTDSENRLHFLLHEWNYEQETIQENYCIAQPQTVRTDRRPLSVGFLSISRSMEQKLIRFNAQSEDVYLEAVDFRNIGESAFYAVSSDLVIMDETAYDSMSGRGTLADLAGFLRSDEQFNDDAIISSVLDALSERSGAVRRLAACFRIESMVCSSEVLQQLTPFTMERLREYSMETGAGAALYEPFYTSDRLLTDLCLVNRRALENDTKESIQLYSELEMFSKLQPAQYSYGNYAADSAGTERRLTDGRIAMMQSHLGCLDDLKWYDALFDGSACFVGWPSEAGGRSRFCFDESVGISAVCTPDEQNAAWQFVRTLLDGENRENQYGFPVTNALLESEMKRDMEKVSYRVDADGEFELDRNGEKIEIPRSTWYTSEWKKHYVMALTEEQSEKLMDLIDHCV